MPLFLYIAALVRPLVKSRHQLTQGVRHAGTTDALAYLLKHAEQL